MLKKVALQYLPKNYTKKKIVALGGISKVNINQIKLINEISSFAGISYFE